MKTVALSAGHSLSDPGAVHKDLKEADLTRKITAYAADVLRASGVSVLTIPDNLDLFQTIKYINDRANQIDVCVEVHINSGGGRGVEGWNYAGGPNESDKLSQCLVDGCVVETGLVNRGIKDESQNRHGRLGFVHDTFPTAALVECGFIDGDYDFLKQDENLRRLAKGVARGIMTYLGIPWTAPAPPPPSTIETDKLKKQIAQLEQEKAVLYKAITDAKAILNKY